MLIVKQGDRFPDVEEVVKDETGAIVDLTAATVKFSMRPARRGTDPNAVSLSLVAATLVNGPLGKISYQWGANETNTPGTYEGEFFVTPSGGGDAFHVPTDGYIEIVIEPKVA